MKKLPREKAAMRMAPNTRIAEDGFELDIEDLEEVKALAKELGEDNDNDGISDGISDDGNEDSGEDADDGTEPDETGTSKEDAKRLEDACMTFLESTEGRLTYHQAQLMRLACEGFDSHDVLDRAGYILNRARLVCEGRPEALPIEDAMNRQVMDFLEKDGWSLEFHEWEVIRLVCRGCDKRTLDEIAFVLERARTRHGND